jgi:hypothetical protein
MSDARESHDVYLVLHPFADNVREFRILVRPLADLDPLFEGAEGFYRADLDIALLVLRFSGQARERLGDEVMAMFCGRSGLPMVIPNQLDAAQRRAFFLEHLSGYTTYVQLYPGDAGDPDAPYEEPMSLGERVLAHLEDHIGRRPRLATARFDVEAQLPVANPRRDRWRSSTT